MFGVATMTLKLMVFELVQFIVEVWTISVLDRLVFVHRRKLFNAVESH